MIPTVLVVAVALGRWWWQTLLAAAIGWPLVVLGVGAIEPAGVPSAAGIGVANAAVGVVVNRGVAHGLRVLRRFPGPGRGADPGVAGGALVLGAVGLDALGVGSLSLVDAMLLVGVLAVVPGAVPLVPPWAPRHAPVALAAGVPVIAALLLEQGVLAALLVVPWIAVTVLGAWVAARWWWHTRPGWSGGAWVVASGYLVVGAVWLAADRLALSPAGVTAPFVLLTAIHFHHAGFGAAVLAACTWRAHPSRGAAAALVLVLAGPPVVAAGFLLHGLLQVLGAIVLAAGLWVLAWQVVVRVRRRVTHPARVVLVASALATLAPMVLAVQWAAGSAFGTPALSIPAMARWHGVANAVGFVLLGVVGWRLVDAEAQRSLSGT